MTPVTEAAECARKKSGDAPPLDPRTRKLMDALTGHITDDKRRLDILHDAARNTEADAGVQYFLAQRALLTVAGELLQRGRFDESRALLRSVDTQSPVAVEAALLLADSWRMQGNRDKARDWYLRAGTQFPHELLALKGMLSAGHAMEPEAPGVAATLYDHVHEQAMDSKQELEEIPEEKKAAGLNWLLSDQHGLPAALHSQLSRRILKRGDESLMVLEKRREHSEVDLRCIIKRAGDLEQAHARIAGKVQELERSIAAIDTRMTQLEKRIDTLQSGVTPGEMDEGQIQLREELVRRKNEHKRLEGQLIFLRQNRERLPVMLHQLQQRIRKLHAEHHTENREVNQSIRELVVDSVDALIKDFLDIAAESRDAKARLMEKTAATPE